MKEGDERRRQRRGIKKEMNTRDGQRVDDFRFLFLFPLRFVVYSIRKQECHGWFQNLTSERFQRKRERERSKSVRC